MRVLHWTRLTTIGLLLACALAALPAAASATTPDVRGEWTLVLKYSGGTFDATALITKEADGAGKFAAQSVLLNGTVPGGFNGTLEGATATVETSSQQYGSIPPGKFNSSTMTVESTANSLSLSGSGILMFGGQEYPATLVATRVKTQQQIEEQEAREKREQEERAARANVRGEWAITLEGGGKTLKGTALISKAADSKNMFASESALFEEGLISGSFGGTLEGEEAEVTITTSEVPGVVPSGTFTGKKIAVSSKANPTSMTGAGTFQFGPPSGASFPATLTATRVRSHQQVEEQATKEREAKEKAEQEAKEKAEREAKEKREREEKERQEALEKAKLAEKVPLLPKAPLQIIPPSNPLVPVLPAVKTLTVGHSGAISLKLENPGASTEHGLLKLTVAKGGKAASTKHSSAGGTLGQGSFTIAAHGSEVVAVKLSQSGRAQLTRHKTLQVLLTVTTEAAGQPTTTKTYTITLHAAKAAHRKR
jgi:hypothetical protein